MKNLVAFNRSKKKKIWINISTYYIFFVIIIIYPVVRLPLFYLGSHFTQVVKIMS